MTILGISPSHDGTLTVIRDGSHIFSIAEERLNRIKAYTGFPFESLRYIIKEKIVDPKEVDVVAVSMGTFKKEWARTMAFLLTEDKQYYDLQNEKPGPDFYLNDKEWKAVQSDEECKAYVEKKIRTLLLAVGISAEIAFFDHHACHAASAYYASGEDDVLAITLDGEGDLCSGSVRVCSKGQMETLTTVPSSASLGWLYSEMTRFCGFKVSRHEGKITGLAALGNPEQGWEILKKQILVEDGAIIYPHSTPLWKFYNRVRMKLKLIPYSSNPWRIIIDSISHLPQKDMAAAVQYALEQRACEFISYWVQKTGKQNLVLAGGIFANVKLNQRISEMPSVQSLFVFPDMGDGGNAYGAAMLAYHRTHPYTPQERRMKDAYLGPQFDDAAIERALSAESLIVYRKTDTIEQETAALIAEKKIVGWFQGRMEYGPRALGNRSVLAHPTDASINKWLNDRMKRTEFMPFAPSCLYEASEELFHMEKSSMKRPAEFMTITFDMKKEWVEKASAVAHVDGTARPQLVRQDTNPRFHALLTEYKKLTGLPLVINTSFNVHEEPIVCTPDDALKSLTSGMIDVLAIGDYLATKR